MVPYSVCPLEVLWTARDADCATERAFCWLNYSAREMKLEGKGYVWFVYN